MSATITRAHLATLTPGEAAALWLVQQDRGSPVEAGLFDEWLERDEGNRRAWDAAQGAWNLFDDVDDPAFTALRQAAMADSAEARAAGRWTRWRPAAAAAALVAVVAGGLQLGRGHLDGGARQASGSDAIDRVYAATATAPGYYALPDGTAMTLDAGARARASISANGRRIVLERGGAVFAVRHDAARPFTVTARDRTIVDVGTRFRVGVEADGVRVALYEGSVRVGDAAGHATVLRPGQQLVARAGRRDLITFIAADDGSRGGLVQFDDVTLATAAETVNQGSAVKLAIVDPKVAALRVSGRFRAGDPERFARSASALLSLRVVRVGPYRIELRRRR